MVPAAVINKGKSREARSCRHSRVVSGQRRHRGEHIHVLGPADPGHRLEAKRGDAPLQEGLEGFGVAARVQHAHQGRSLLQAAQVGRFGPADHDRQVGAAEQRRTIGGQLGSGFAVHLVTESGGRTGADLDGHRGSRLDDLGHGFGDQRHTGLAPSGLGGNGDSHAPATLLMGS